ncbi:MAG: hypothetical protein IT384_23350 [Deltaproteobacteria bacterium]|nr:hypothetical protein [Deltaproteobacteria bacterium]
MRRLARLPCALVLLLAACGGEDPPPPPKEAPDFVALAADYAPGALLSIWSGSPNDVWVVGGELGKPVVLRFDGMAWRRDDPPIAQQLWWVHGFTGGPVFVVGEGGAIARSNNGAWEVMDSGHPGTTFYGVWAASPSDVWAVGGEFLGATSSVTRQGDVIVHYDGTRWNRVRLPYLDSKPMSAQKNLFKVWGTRADRVFIVGDGGLALHYDGASWAKHETGVTGAPLFTVSGRGENDVWAIGGLGAPALIHWDGSRWSEVALPADAPQVMQGLWTASGQPVVVSGYGGYVACRSDDGQWAVSAEKTRDALHAVWGDGEGLWASGGNIVSFLPDYHGALLSSGREVPALPVP